MGPEIPLPADALVRLKDLINREFGEDSAVASVHQAGKGGNNANHVVVKMQKDGTHFGLKKPSRGAANGNDNEKLVADLAVCLGIPNACPVVQTKEIDFIPAFSGQTVNVIRWLPNPKTLDELTPDQKKAMSAAKGKGSFYFRMGEWMAFGLMFGVRDRANDGNWAVDSNDLDCVVMIDLEEALGGPGQFADYSWLRDYVDLTQAKEQRFKYRPLRLFCQGYFTLWKKFVAREKEVREKLHQHSFAAGFQCEYMTKKPDVVLRDFLGLLCN